MYCYEYGPDKVINLRRTKSSTRESLDQDCTNEDKVKGAYMWGSDFCGPLVVQFNSKRSPIMIHKPCYSIRQN